MCLRAQLALVVFSIDPIRSRFEIEARPRSNNCNRRAKGESGYLYVFKAFKMVGEPSVLGQPVPGLWESDNLSRNVRVLRNECIRLAHLCI
jgi:hypothetical protein